MNRVLIGALSTSVATALLAGCGGSQSPIATPGAVPQGREVSQPAGPAVRAMPDVTKIIYVTSPTYRSKILGFKLGSTGNAKPCRNDHQLLYVFANLPCLRPERKALRRERFLRAGAGLPGRRERQRVGRGTRRIDNTPSRRRCVDAFGQIYVSDVLSNEIYVWKKDAVGNVSPIRTSRGPRRSSANLRGMACDSHGNLWVANSAYTRASLRVPSSSS